MMTKGLSTLVVAVLVIPPISPALGQSTVGLAARPVNISNEAWQALPLPPVPHLESMPWLQSDVPITGLSNHSLLGPKLDTLGPFLLQPKIPPTRVTSSSQSFDPRAKNE
jgi:hypothetical protein